MQLFVRCGRGSVAIDCNAQERVLDVKQRLHASHGLGSPEDMVLMFAGRQVHDEDTLASCGITSSAFLQMCGRVRGGGGDGGSTGSESRSCYLEMYLGKKVAKVNPAEELLARWTRCRLSGEPLTPPVVIDELGNLFNKESLLHALIAKSLPPTLGHITSLKHVTDLQLHTTAGGGGAAADAATTTSASFQPSNDSPFSCPVTGAPWNGRFKFVVHRSSGRAISERAVREAPAVVEDLVGQKTSDRDWLVVNPVGEALAAAQAAVVARIDIERHRKAAKAGKGRDKAAAAAAAPIANGSGDGASTAPPHDSDGRDQDASAAAGKKRSLTHAEPGGTATARNGAAIAGPTSTAVTNGSSSHLGPGEASQAAALNGSKAKRYKASEHVPVGATKSIYSSLFSSSHVGAPIKETYCCRATSAHGMKMG